MIKITDLFIRVLCLAVLLGLSACGYIKSWFPDKEKDYQYTTEIPELVIPPDLKNSPALSLPGVAAKLSADLANAQPAIGQTEAVQTSAATATALESQGVDDQPAAETLAAEAVPPEATADSSLPDSNQTAVKREPIPVELVKSGEQASLRLHAPFAVAWRAVDKALSRKSIEVIRRNSEEKRFDVQYDPDEHKLEDSSIWDEAAFIFSGFQGNDKAYSLKLAETGNQTEVLVLDEGQRPTTDAGAIALLNLLQETIKTDFTK